MYKLQCRSFTLYEESVILNVILLTLNNTSLYCVTFMKHRPQGSVQGMKLEKPLHYPFQ